MSESKYLTKEELIEKYDFLDEVSLNRGIKLVKEEKISKVGLIREFETKDQTAVGKDARAKNNDFVASALLIQKIFYIEVEENQYRNLTYPEIESIKGSDQRLIVNAMQKISGEVENF